MKLFLILVIASTLGCLLGAFIESGNGHDAQAVTSEVAPPSFEKVVIRSKLPAEASLSSPIKPATFPTSEEVAVQTPPLSSGDVAHYCDSINLTTHPEKAAEMVRVASAAYGTPAGLLNGIWHTESHHGINGQTGSCRVMEQYSIRDCWKPGYTTHRPAGCTSPYIFVGETPSDSRWKSLPKHRRVGNGAVQKQSIIRIAKALGIDAWSIKGSCGNRILTGLKYPGKPGTHGGCFGNMQITPDEWEKDVKAMGYGLSELTPFNICDSLLVSSYRLKKHHDQRLAKYAKSIGKTEVTDLHDQLSWLWSGRRYYGNPDKYTSNTYERTLKYGRSSASFRCGWACWDKMASANKGKGDFRPLTEYIHKRAYGKWPASRRIRLLEEKAERRYASN